MATVKKCDRCGKIYEKDEYSNIGIVEKRTSGAILNRYDICPDCVDCFHEFIGEKIVEDNIAKYRAEQAGL